MVKGTLQTSQALCGVRRSSWANHRRKRLYENRNPSAIFREMPPFERRMSYLGNFPTVLRYLSFLCKLNRLFPLSQSIGLSFWPTYSKPISSGPLIFSSFCVTLTVNLSLANSLMRERSRTPTCPLFSLSYTAFFDLFLCQKPRLYHFAIYAI